MESIINIKRTVDTKDFTLIIPSVSVGNVGQLTIDLLISSYNFKRFATIWDSAIIPSVGGDPFITDSTDVSTACELYVKEDVKLMVMQLRSSIEYKLASKFFKKLKSCILSFKCKKVIILSSTFAYELRDINSTHFRYITNIEGDEVILKNLNVQPLEANPNGRFTIYGAGFATKLYETLSDSLSCVLLVKYTSEGDNRPDALQMLDVLHNILGKLKIVTAKNVIFPNSWQYVFGNPPPIGIY